MLKKRDYKLKYVKNTYKPSPHFKKIKEDIYLNDINAICLLKWIDHNFH